MDKTVTEPLSGPQGGHERPTDLLRFRAAQAFRHLASHNPLNKLRERERIAVAAILNLHSLTATEKLSIWAAEERLAKTMAGAAALGAKLESEVFRGPLSELLQPYILSFADIPKRLVEMSKLLEDLLGSLGKPGHKGRNFSNRWLIIASEIVRLHIGQNYDEHLAELFQAVVKGPVSEDLSGDAIRKKREYMKKRYPELYASALRDAKRICLNLCLRDPFRPRTAN